MRLKQAIDLFLGEYQKATTRRAYAYCLNDMMGYIGPARPVGDISKPLLIEYGQYLERRGWAPATIQKHIKTIKIFFNWLVRMDLLDKSPAKVLRQKRLPMQITRDKAMSDSEYAQVLEWVKWKPRDHALILFLGDTGCRAGGASGLREEDLDLDVQRAMVTEKGDQSRLVAYGEACAMALRTWLLQRQVIGEDRYVFSRDGTKLTAATISQIVRRACAKVGVRSLGAHSLRHRKGHQLADNKVPVSVAARALGHKNPLTTMTHYYPADWESAEKELRKLAQPLEQNPKVVKLPLERHS